MMRRRRTLAEAGVLVLFGLSQGVPASGPVSIPAAEAAGGHHRPPRDHRAAAYPGRGARGDLFLPAGAAGRAGQAARHR